MQWWMAAPVVGAAWLGLTLLTCGVVRAALAELAELDPNPRRVSAARAADTGLDERGAPPRLRACQTGARS